MSDLVQLCSNHPITFLGKCAKQNCELCQQKKRIRELEAENARLKSDNKDTAYLETEIARLDYLHKLDLSLADQWLARAAAAEAKVARVNAIEERTSWGNDPHVDLIEGWNSCLAKVKQVLADKEVE